MLTITWTGVVKWIGAAILLGMPLVSYPATAKLVGPSIPSWDKANQVSSSPYLSSENSLQRPQPSLGELDQQPVAYVMPNQGQASLHLVNNTPASVYVESMDGTVQYLVPPGEEAVLEQVPLPLAINAWRDDNGFLVMIPMAAPERSGLLEIFINAVPNPVENHQGILRIQPDGQVFLN